MHVAFPFGFRVQVPYEERHRLDSSTQEDPSALGGHILGRSLPSDAGSDYTLHLAASLIQDCLSSHPECAEEEIAADPGHLPARVLDVSPDGLSSDNVRLSTHHVRPGEYTCLSYCWGGGVSPLKTTSENIVSRLQAIPFSALPKTNQDAIKITRSLGVHYIWIDALCIVQGPSPNQDWERESSKMGSIYKNAYCTIAAAAAQDCQGGCFIPREPLYPEPVRVRTRCGDGPVGYVYFRDVFGDFTSNVSGGPLDERGWTLQERVLSTRILHFGKDQVFFQCNRGIRGECGHQYENNVLAGTSPLLIQLNEVFKSSRIEEIRPKLQSFWFQLVMEFTARKLTFETDKLPALAGLANQIRRQTGGEQYFAGLWRSCFHRQLLWFVANDDVDRPDAYRSPSWSWAAVDGRIRYPNMLVLNNWQRDESAIEIVATHLVAAGEDSSGALLEGSWVRLAGKVTPMIISTDVATRAGIARALLRAEDGVTIGWAVPDETKGVSEDCLGLLVWQHSKIKFHESHPWFVHNVLLLKNLGDPNGCMYGRVGTGLVDPKLRVFDCCSRTVIDIA